MSIHWQFFFFFFFNDTATTEIYTLSLHDALPISRAMNARMSLGRHPPPKPKPAFRHCRPMRSEEHTSELQSQSNLVCRLLLEKKKNKRYNKSLCPYHTTAAVRVSPHDILPCLRTH